MADQKKLGALLAQGAGGDIGGGPTSLPKQQTPMQQKMQGLMSNPNFRAFMLNMGANLAAGNNLGMAAAQGGAGVARATRTAYEMERAEQARQDALTKSARRGGSGGGRGGASNSAAVAGLGIDGKIKRKELVSMYEASLERLQLTELADDMSREELKGMAWIETLSGAGQGTPAEVLAQLEDPSQRSQFLVDFSFGPESGIRKMRETAAQGQAVLDEINTTPQPPVNTAVPAQPIAPVIATPDISFPAATMPPAFGSASGVVDGQAPAGNSQSGGFSLGNFLTGNKSTSATRKRRNPLDADIPPP